MGNGMEADVREPRRPALIMFCGLPGAGKTTLARERAREAGAIRISTDEWMADLGLDYFDDRRGSVQARLDALGRQLLAHGQSVLVEDGTWKRAERDELRRLAIECDATTELHVFDIPLDELWRRLEIRNRAAERGTAPITRELLLASETRLEQPDDAELALFDRWVVHR